MDPQALPLMPFDGPWSIHESTLRAIEHGIRRFDPVAARLEVKGATLASEPRVEGSTAIVSLMGPMEKRVTLFGWLMGFTATDLVRRQVEQAAANDAVKTIVLRIDSPGGAVDGLAELGDAVWKARDSKKVIAQVDGMMASAALYVGAQASEVNAGRMDLIGSIGTRMTLWDMSKYFEEAGVKVIPVDTGEYKSAGEPGTPITDAQVAYFQGIVDAYFADFKKAVARGRGLTASAVDAVADGRIFVASEAKALGLIDQIQTHDSTMNKLRGGKRVAAGLPAKLKAQRFELLHR